MESLLDFAYEERYKRVEDLGDKVAEFDTLIEWERFRPIIGDLYTNTTEQGGRPNIDVLLMVKLLVLQSMYGLSDPELERLANDRNHHQMPCELPGGCSQPTKGLYSLSLSILFSRSSISLFSDVSIIFLACINNSDASACFFISTNAVAFTMRSN